MKYHGVFFDFDYTLGDSTPAIAEGYRLGFADLGLDPPTLEQVRHTIGMTLSDGYSFITGDHDPQRQEAFYHSFQHTVGVKAEGAGRRLMIEGTTLFPGAVELLRALGERGVRTAIVSTKPGDTIRRIFERQEHSDLLDLVVGGDEVQHSKPNPEGLRMALERLGLGAEDVLFCGDTVIDAATAQAGGCQFCAVLNGTTRASAFDRFPCVHIAPDLTELKDWLRV